MSIIRLGREPAVRTIAGIPNGISLQSLTHGTDPYTVIFQWKTSNSEFINELVNSADASNQITCPDAVKAYNNDLSDWHHAVGCGPFMVTDYISGSSATFDANPNYYGVDERHPGNKLPYVAHVNVLIMPEAGYSPGSNAQRQD